jgi:hypothetical protein
MAVRMDPAKKEKETKKRKDPLQYSSPSSNNTSTTKTTPELLFILIIRGKKTKGKDHPSFVCPTCSFGDEQETGRTSFTMVPHLLALFISSKSTCLTALSLH